MKRLHLAIAIAAVLGTAGVGAAHASATPRIEAPSAAVNGAGARDWVCVSLDYVHVGTCVSDPLYPIGAQGGVVGIVERHTGTDLPGGS